MRSVAAVPYKLLFQKKAEQRVERLCSVKPYSEEFDSP